MSAQDENAEVLYASTEIGSVQYNTLLLSAHNNVQEI